MRRVRVYLDTSVFGGAVDDEFAVATRRFFDRVRRGEFAVLVSPLTLDELAAAPDSVQQILRDLPGDSLTEVVADEETMALAQAYLDAGILARSSIADALHVAIATVAGADVVLSWNFKHIVNYDRIHGYNGVNALKGYPAVEIHSPLEMIRDERD